MSGEPIGRALALFRQACQLPEEQRSGFLDSACGDDTALRAEVQSMLRWDETDDEDDAEPHPMRAALSHLVREAETGAAAATDAAPAALPPNIGGYRVVRLIARGGMGDVYEAVQESPRRRVAIKVARVGGASAERTHRFELEVQLLANLRHPRIAQIIEAGATESDAGRQPFFVMEFVEGQPLTDYAARNLQDSREKLELMAAVCDAIGFAHERGVVHRDLKPDNVLIEPGGEPKVLDFGVAKVEEAGYFGAATLHTEAGRVLGTLGYMAPEQLGGRTDGLGPEADVYSLGVMIYELLSGRLPHELDAVTWTRALAVVTTTDAPRLGTIRPEYRGDVEAIVAKALEKEPRDRYPDAAALQADLGRYLRGEPIHARRAGALLRLRRWSRRNPTLATAVFGLFLTLATATGILWGKNAEIVAVLDDLLLLRDSSLTLEQAREAAAEMWPTRASRAPALAEWCQRYEAFAESLEGRRAMLTRMEDHGVGDGSRSSSGRDWLLELRRQALQDLVRHLTAFKAEHGLLALVQRRRDLARTIETDTVGAFGREWDEAIARIGGSERYDGLRIERMVGFVPLGPDPKSGFEEFLHFETHSGPVPTRDAAGRVEITAATGLVFVLLPGDRFTMGAQTDPNGPNYDPQAWPEEGPVHPVIVSPFLLSKYEMTAGQWLRATGTNPSMNDSGRPAPTDGPALLEPVQGMTWSAADRLMGNLGLRLPTEAQWEYAARAGEEGQVWPGLDCVNSAGPGSEGFEELARYANLLDQDAKDERPHFHLAWDARLRDGEPTMAKIGGYLPSPWGFHDIIGNAFEWCGDDYIDYDPSASDGDHPRRLETPTARAVFRGGCWFFPSTHARVAIRGAEVRRRAMFQTGVRPAAGVELAP